MTMAATNSSTHHAQDNGRTVWYFSAPEKFLGEKAFAHNGKLSFRLGHSEYMSNGKDMIKDWDVILESKEWRLRVGIKNLIPPWVGATNNDLDLNEKAWTVMKGQGHGHSPTTIQMIRILSSLSAIYIRGGYYDGHEETWLDSVSMIEGNHEQDAMLRKINKHHHEPLKAKKAAEEQKRKAEVCIFAWSLCKSCSSCVREHGRVCARWSLCRPFCHQTLKQR